MTPKKGRIIPNGVTLEKHEFDTIVFLTTLGNDVELIPPKHIPNMLSPDIKMAGEVWEIKSPKGSSRSTLEHAFQHAVKQSPNIIFDLRRTDIPLEKSKHTLSKLMQTSKNAKRLAIITKDRNLLYFPFDKK